MDGARPHQGLRRPGVLLLRRRRSLENGRRQAGREGHARARAARPREARPARVRLRREGAEGLPDLRRRVRRSGAHDPILAGRSRQLRPGRPERSAPLQQLRPLHAHRDARRGQLREGHGLRHLGGERRVRVPRGGEAGRAAALHRGSGDGVDEGAPARLTRPRAVPPSALALALGAAVLHATWNVLLAGSRDSEAATAVATLAGVALLAPVAIATGGVETAALPFAAASAALHVAYLALLARAYRGGEVSVVYPVSRGVAPVLVLAVGAAALGEGASTVQVGGVLAVSAGAFLVQYGPLPGRRDLLFGLTIAAVIAAYTLVDAEGVEHSRAPAYLALLLSPAAVIYTAALWIGGGGAPARAAPRPPPPR